MIKISFIIVSNVSFNKTIILLNSLDDQIYKLDFEVICVDQVESSILKQVCEKLGFKYICVNTNSLSESRNIAINIAKNEHIILLDDDASILPNYFENLSSKSLFYSKYDIIGSRILCEGSLSRYSKRQGGTLKNINLLNFELILSSGLIIKKEVFDNIGTFDENFGVGSKWNACEESDIILRAITYNYKIIYDPENITIHPSNSKSNLVVLKNKFYMYGIGRGALVKKHLVTFKLLSFYQIVLFPLAMMFFSLFILNQNKFICYLFSFLGRIRGFVQYKS